MEGREDECTDSHEWNPRILGHHRFRAVLDTGKLPARTIRELDAMRYRAKINRDAQGKSKSNTLKIGYKTKHSLGQNGSGGPILSETTGESSSWAEDSQREADLVQREIDVDDNPRA